MMQKLRWQHIAFCLIVSNICFLAKCNGNDGEEEPAIQDTKQNTENTAAVQTEDAVDKSGIYSSPIPETQSPKNNQENLAYSKTGYGGKEISQSDDAESVHVSQSNLPVSHPVLSDKSNNNAKNDAVSGFSAKEVQADGTLINEKNSIDEVLFEENENENELLVDQMKRLSEKIKMKQDSNSKYVENVEYKEKLVLHSESHGKNKKQMDRLKRSQELKQNQEVQATDFKANEPINRLGEFPNVDNTKTDDTASESGKETVVEQLRKMEEKFQNGELFVPFSEVNNNENDFPSDERSSENSEANDQNQMEMDLPSTIDNTKPPQSGSHAHKTQVYDAVQFKVDNAVDADRTLVREMSTVNDLKPSSVLTFSQTEQNYFHSFENTADKLKNTRAKQNKRIKKFRESMKQKHQVLQGTTLSTDKVLKTDEIMSSRNTAKHGDILATQTLDILASQSRGVSQDGQGLQYSGTAHEEPLTSVSIQHSSTLPSREMHKTEVKQPAAQKLDSDIGTQANNEQNLQKSTDELSREKGN